MPELDLANAVVSVHDGRGFIVEAHNETRFIITAAHCLPSLPAAGALYIDRTYTQLLGELDIHRSVTGAVRFVDPVADLAVIEQPDNQTLPEEARAFARFVANRPALKIGDVIDPDWMADETVSTQAWLLTLEGLWTPCKVMASSDALLISAPEYGVRPGMSGSPIVDADGRAIGVLATGTSDEIGLSDEEGPNPRLMHDLPAWLVRELADMER